jgi:hypothetical protein
MPDYRNPNLDDLDDLDAVLDAVAAGHNYVGGPAAVGETYRRLPNVDATLAGQMDASEAERLTAPIPFAHLEGLAGTDADEASAAYTALRATRDRLDDAADRFYRAAASAAGEPGRAADAAREAIEAGLPVPVVVPTDLASLEATLRAEHSALAGILTHQAALYRNAAYRVAPAARAMLAERLAPAIDQTKAFWQSFETANDERLGIVDTLADLNRICDPQYRDLLPDDRDRKLGGSLVAPGEVFRAQRRASAAAAIATLTGILGSNDPLVTGAYVADELLTGGAFPIWYRRALVADGDVEQIRAITRADAEPVDLDTIPTPTDKWRASLERHSTPTSARGKR